MQQDDALQDPRAKILLRRLAGGVRAWLTVAVAIGLAGGALAILQAWLLASVVAGAAVEGLGSPDLAPYLAALLAVWAARAAARWGFDMAGFAAAQRVKARLRAELFAALAARGPRRLPGGSGDLAGALVEHVEALEGYYARFLPQAVVAAAIPLVALAVVFPMNWVVGGLLLATAPLMPLFMTLAGLGAAQASRRQFQALGRMGARFLDRLRNMSTLQLFGQAEAEQGRIAEAADDYRRRTMGVLKIAFISSATLEFFASISIALVAVYIGLGLLGAVSYGGADEMGLRAGLFFLLLAPEYFQPLRQLAADYHDRAAAQGAAPKLVEILEPTAAPPQAALPAPAASPEIAFDDVRLARGGRAILDGFRLRVPAGAFVALVGPSGAGKTTALDLLAGFLRPDSGRLRVNGRDLELIDLESWRRGVAWVGQRGRLMQGTIRSNLLIAKPDADEADLRDACRRARVDEFLGRLPGGLDCLVGEGGYGLSGGQAQRVALARAFLKDAPLLLLDEPTAHLDRANELLVLDAVAELARGRTTLMATHSALAAARADMAVRLKPGAAGARVAEAAT